MQMILPSMIIGSLFLLAFVSFINPRKVNVIANRWLAFFFFAVACAVASPVVTDDTVVRFIEFSRFAMAPALYLSVLYFTSPGKRFKSIDLLHFIPFLLFAIFAVIPIIPASFKDTLAQWVMQITHIHPGFLVFMSVKLQAVIYWTLSWLRLRQHEKNVKLFASAISPIDLWWLRYLLVGLAMMLVLWLNQVLFDISFIITITPFGYLAAVYFVAYFSLRQGEIFAFNQQAMVEIKEIIHEEKEKPIARQSRLSDVDFETAKQKLEQLMTVDKLFLNSTLGLPELAAKMNASSHQVSYLINEGYGENFFQFINRYRVEEAKRLLTSEMHRHFNMLGIAFESGFNSKTTFNTTFKKVTGFSPSEYQQQREASSSPSSI
jgi:AraC-like DNA-binding protein